MLHIFLLHCVCSLTLLVRGLISTRGLFYLKTPKITSTATPVIIFLGGLVSLHCTSSHDEGVGRGSEATCCEIVDHLVRSITTSSSCLSLQSYVVAKFCLFGVFLVWSITTTQEISSTHG